MFLLFADFSMCLAQLAFPAPSCGDLLPLRLSLVSHPQKACAQTDQAQIAVKAKWLLVE